MKEFKVNEFISLRFQYPHTEIYINGKYFMQCKRLVLNIPKTKIEQYNNIESVDEATEMYDHTLYESQVLQDDGAPEIENDENFSLIPPQEEFWGHCSNLQVWGEHNYDTRLLKANLAFPLLKRLAKTGDNLAQVKFKEEILKRLLSGSESVIEYLFVEGYQDYLNNEEIIFGLLETREAEVLIEIQQKANVEFKFVPSIDRDIGFNPPINLEKVRKVRKFSIERNYIKGLNLKFNELVKLSNKILNLKNLKQIRLHGNFSELNTNEIIETIQRLKGIEEIFLNSRLIKKLDNTSLKEIKKIGIKISPILVIFPY